MADTYNNSATFPVQFTDRKTSDPDEKDYKLAKPGFYKASTVFRIWNPSSTKLYLATFIVGKDLGTYASYLRIVYKLPKRESPNFERD
jgi:hypothetical protein